MSGIPCRRDGPLSSSRHRRFQLHPLLELARIVGRDLSHWSARACGTDGHHAAQKVHPFTGFANARRKPPRPSNFQVLCRLICINQPMWLCPPLSGCQYLGPPPIVSQINLGRCPNSFLFSCAFLQAGWFLAPFPAAPVVQEPGGALFSELCALANKSESGSRGCTASLLPPQLLQEKSFAIPFQLMRFQISLIHQCNMAAPAAPQTRAARRNILN